MTPKFLLFFLPFLCISLSGIAQNTQNITADSVFSAIYHFRFNTAHQMIVLMENDDTSLVTIKAYLLYWEALSGINPDENFNDAERLINQRLPDEKDPYNEISLKLLKIRILISQQKYMSVFFTLNELKYFFQNNSLSKNTTSYHKLIWGLYHYYATVARNKNLFYTRFLSDWPSSDKDNGLAILSLLTNEPNVFIKNENLYFLSRIYSEFEKRDILAENYLQHLINDYPENSIYKELYLKFLIQSNRESEFIKIRESHINFMKSSGMYTHQQIDHFIKVTQLSRKSIR